MNNKNTDNATEISYNYECLTIKEHIKECKDSTNMAEEKKDSNLSCEQIECLEEISDCIDELEDALEAEVSLSVASSSNDASQVRVEDAIEELELHLESVDSYMEDMQHQTKAQEQEWNDALQEIEGRMQVLCEHLDEYEIDG